MGIKSFIKSNSKKVNDFWWGKNSPEVIYWKKKHEESLIVVPCEPVVEEKCNLPSSIGAGIVILLLALVSYIAYSGISTGV